MEELLVHEEAYWKQRAKFFWLLDGDSNLKYFHAYATSRKKENNISQLQDENNEFVTNYEGMHHVVEKYVINIFGQDNDLQEQDFPNCEEVVTEAQNRRLKEDFTFEKFSKAINQMHPEKSTGLVQTD